jgi:hypothetical protein
MVEAKVPKDREQWRQIQVEEQLVRLELKKALELVAMAAEKEAMGT